MENFKELNEYNMITKVVRFPYDNLSNYINDYIVSHQDDFKGVMDLSVTKTTNDYIDIAFTWSTYEDAPNYKLIGVLFPEVAKYKTPSKLDEIRKKYDKDIEIDMLTRIFINNYESRLLLAIYKPLVKEIDNPNAKQQVKVKTLIK